MSESVASRSSLVTVEPRCLRIPNRSRNLIVNPVVWSRPEPLRSGLAVYDDNEAGGAPVPDTAAATPAGREAAP
ncbi:hypothetical protein GCM10010402_08570 [Actinomadura luteofluorescens]